MSEPWHGTSGGYSNHHCRCDRCRRAWATMMSSYRRKRFHGQSCIMEGCKKKQAAAAGNGLCWSHHEKLVRRAA